MKTQYTLMVEAGSKDPVINLTNKKPYHHRLLKQEAKRRAKIVNGHFSSSAIVQYHPVRKD